MQLEKLKIKKIEKLNSTKVHDLTVSEAQHYITSNGVVNHNTGPEYAASIILFLGKAQLAEGGEKTGIIVTAKPNKNRFAKPTPIKFHIDFSKGMNPYVGLQDFISWDTCGVQRGRFISQKDFDKMKDGDKETCKKHEYMKEDKLVTVYFQPSETARGLAVRHLNDVVKLNELFTPKVITEDVLKLLDQNIIKNKFSYGTDEEFEEDLHQMIEEETTEDGE